MSQKSSLFIDLVNKYMGNVVGGITERFNGEAEERQPLYKTKLKEEFTPTLTWANTELQHSVVAADVVSMDSSLPLKSRPTIERASGTVPKVGMKLQMKESTLRQLMTMQAMGGREAEIASKLFEDTANVIKGVRSRVEYMFLKGLSTGVTLVQDSENTGTGIRVDFGYLNENKFKATTAAWASSTATPISDLQQVFDKADADGVTIAELYISKQYIEYMRNTTEGKRLCVQGENIDDANLQKPRRSEMIEALKDEFGCEVTVVNETIRIEEADGTFKSVKPWENGSVVGVIDSNVGRLVYGENVEENHKVEGVNYEKADSFILVSKYSYNDPLREFTASQSFVLPVIDNAKYTYVLDASSVSGGTGNPGDMGAIIDPN